jgi:hypothetical protein
MGVRTNVMPRYLASLAFALCLSSPAFAGTEAAGETSAAPVAVQQARVAPGLRDEAAMVLIGTALIGLAAAVRRAAA